MNPYYEFMKSVEPGDVVISYKDKRIRAVGIAIGRYQNCVKPDFGGAGANWNDTGWMVEVEFQELSQPVAPLDYFDRLLPLLDFQHAPLKRNGHGKELYLTELSGPFALAIMDIIGQQFSLTTDLAKAALDSSAHEEAVRMTLARPDVPPAVVQQLINARRGQGLFRTRVRILEPICRVTGVAEKHHLRASHIKPWASSTDDEKLDGANGLLLAPHIDHLFDRGFITFDDNGDMWKSPSLEGDVSERWALVMREKPRPFNSDQKHFLAFHRAEIFKAS